MIATLTLPVTVFGIAAMLCLASSRAWRGWLELRRLEIERRPGGPEPDESGLRIELASVKERLRRLEALADGVDP